MAIVKADTIYHCPIHEGNGLRIILDSRKNHYIHFACDICDLDYTVDNGQVFYDDIPGRLDSSITSPFGLFVLLGVKNLNRIIVDWKEVRESNDGDLVTEGTYRVGTGPRGFKTLIRVKPLPPKNHLWLK